MRGQAAKTSATLKQRIENLTREHSGINEDVFTYIERCDQVQAVMQSVHTAATGFTATDAATGFTATDAATDATIAVDVAAAIAADADFYCHVFNGSFTNGTEAKVALKTIVKESFACSSHRGNGIPSVVNIDGTNATFSQVEERVSNAGGIIEINVVYRGTSITNADSIEKDAHQALLNIGIPQEKRMFRRAGAGTCRSRNLPIGVPFPCYVAVLTCNMSMEASGLRLGTKEDKKVKKKDKTLQAQSSVRPISDFFSSSSK
jgi:hypothetical protein